MKVFNCFLLRDTFEANQANKMTPAGAVETITVDTVAEAHISVHEEEEINMSVEDSQGNRTTVAAIQRRKVL